MDEVGLVSLVKKMILFKINDANNRFPIIVQWLRWPKKNKMKLSACKMTYFSLVVKYFLNNVFIRIAFKTHNTYDIIYKIKRNNIIFFKRMMYWTTFSDNSSFSYHLYEITVFSSPRQSRWNLMIYTGVGVGTIRQTDFVTYIVSWAVLDAEWG